jgi:2-oxo-4-hydroxy-4-carboxy-5-ureidoimidazoline decarboxylase
VRVSAERRLTCHVLDASLGVPAAGVALTLSRVTDADVAEVLVRATTDGDGRTGRPLLDGDAFAPGRYLLEADVGGYFAGRPGLGATPWLDVVPLRFGVADDAGHVHVALLVTPWSYTTYRGS